VPRYFAHGPTTGVPHIGAALTPPYHAPSVPKISRGRVYGQPGTEAVRAPVPDAVPQHIDGLAFTGQHRSSDAPPVIFPALYWEAGNAYGDHEHAPVSIMSDNQMPVPAVVPPNVIVASPYYPPRIGGQAQVAQPQTMYRSPKWMGPASA
jgi:hypothetical protein